MAFQSGKVSFVRFRIDGDAPKTVDDTVLSILKDGAFQESDIGVPDAVEAGFITGEHIFDTQFSFEKNGFGLAGSQLLFAMRLDTNKPPSEIKQAYRRMNEQAAAEGNPTGFVGKREKRDAKESAERQLHEDLAAGKFRRSKSVPLLWDLANGTLLCSSSSNTVLEQVSRLMRDHFAVDARYISSGVRAGEVFAALGRTRDYEDLQPSAFTDPPAEFHADQDEVGGAPQHPETPRVPWVQKSIDLKDYLGNEWLLYLWFLAETKDGQLNVEHDGKLGIEPAEAYITFDKTLDMDCAWDTLGKQTLRGDGPTRLQEAGDALRTGKWPRKAGLLLTDGEYHFELTLQADQLSVSAAALPEIEEAQHPRELLEGRLDRTLHLAALLDGMYTQFLKLRSSDQWPNVRKQIRSWIAER